MRARNKIVMAAVMWACASGTASAADGYGVSVYSTAPAALAASPCVSQASCATSGTGLSRSTAAWRGVPDCTASQCGNSRFHKPKPPYTVNLCPGACFGYFPTQWRSWNEVCPPEAGLVTGPVQPPIPPASKNGDGIPQPRPVDPKTEMTTPPPGMSPLPSIPPYPGPGRY